VVDTILVSWVAVYSGSLAAVKLIVERTGRASLELRDADNRTPLILAAMHGHGEVVNYLLSVDGLCTILLSCAVYDLLAYLLTQSTETASVSQEMRQIRSHISVAEWLACWTQAQ